MPSSGTAALAIHRPLYGQVREIVLSRIRQGAWRAGQMLPNEIDLAAEFGVSIGTVRRAIEGLERQGVVTRRQGRGTFVASAGAQLYALESFPLQPVHADAGPLSHVSIRSAQRAPSPEERRQLDLGAAGELVEIVSHVQLRQRTVGREISVFPLARIPSAALSCRSRQHLRSRLGAGGLAAKWWLDRLTIVAAGEACAQALGVALDQPILQLSRITFLPSQQPLELRTVAFLPSELVYVSRGH